MRSTQKPYDGVSLCAPITVPYERFSSETAHWWAGEALKKLSLETGLMPNDFDGIIFSSFSANPDTAVGIVQHLGLCPKWMDHIPTGQLEYDPSIWDIIQDAEQYRLRYLD